MVSLGGAPLDVNPPDHVTQTSISPVLFDILFSEGFGLLKAASAAADTVPALPSHKANNRIRTRLAVPYLRLDPPHMASLFFFYIALISVCHRDWTPSGYEVVTRQLLRSENI